MCIIYIFHFSSRARKGDRRWHTGGGDNKKNNQAVRKRKQGKRRQGEKETKRTCKAETTEEIKWEERRWWNAASEEAHEIYTWGCHAEQYKICKFDEQNLNNHILSKYEMNKCCI